MNAPPTPSRPRHVQLDPATLRPSKPTSVRKGEPAKGGNDAVAPPLPTNLSAFKANSGPFTSDIPPSRPARTDSFPAKNGAGQGWKVENNREFPADGLSPSGCRSRANAAAGNVIVEAGHHLRKMQAHCSWLHLFTHARWLHAGLSASPARRCAALSACNMPAHASLICSFQRSAGPTIPSKSRTESNLRISSECTTI